MLRLLERSIATVDQRLILLAPPNTPVPAAFENVVSDVRRHNGLLQQMQRLRASVYVQDGAVEPHHLTPDGRHQTPEDAKSWHLLMFNRNQRISACAWYLEHGETVRPEDLRVRACPLAGTDSWRHGLRKAVQAEIRRARRDGLQYSEVGGWAVAKESRCTSEALVLALTAYSLGRMCGGALGITTATFRHCSSTILRRLGGSPLVVDGSTVPPYYDPKYKCMMELLRFDSRRPSARYAGLVDLLQEKLANVLVVGAHSPESRDGISLGAPEPVFA